MQRIARLYVHVPDYDSGILEHAGQHVFAYDHAMLGAPDAAISLTMPVRVPSYQSTPMLPALQTFMPEGFIADRTRERFGKTIKMNDMALLALSAGDAIGRLRVSEILGSDTIVSSSSELSLRLRQRDKTDHRLATLAAQALAS